MIALQLIFNMLHRREEHKSPPQHATGTGQVCSRPPAALSHSNAMRREFAVWIAHSNNQNIYGFAVATISTG